MSTSMMPLRNDLAAEAVAGPLLMPHEVRGQRGQFDAFLDGVHAFAVILLEQLCLALVLGPDSQACRCRCP